MLHSFRPAISLSLSLLLLENGEKNLHTLRHQILIKKKIPQKMQIDFSSPKNVQSWKIGYTNWLLMVGWIFNYRLFMLFSRTLSMELQCFVLIEIALTFIGGWLMDDSIHNASCSTNRTKQREREIERWKH